MHKEELCLFTSAQGEYYYSTSISFMTGILLILNYLTLQPSPPQVLKDF